MISIHALHEESDKAERDNKLWQLISIHALHEESDHHLLAALGIRVDISIHTLHEESDRA